METFKRISVNEAQELIKLGKTIIVDVRAPEAYAQSHIENAQSVDDENIDHFLQSTERDLPLICYCYHGFSSQRAAAYFAEQGFKSVYSVDGGYEEWKKLYV